MEVVFGGGGFVEVESSRRETFPSGGTRSKARDVYTN